MSEKVDADALLADTIADIDDPRAVFHRLAAECAAGNLPTAYERAYRAKLADPHASSGADPETDDMTVEFAVSLAEKDQRIAELEERYSAYSREAGRQLNNQAAEVLLAKRQRDEAQAEVEGLAPKYQHLHKETDADLSNIHMAPGVYGETMAKEAGVILRRRDEDGQIKILEAKVERLKADAVNTVRGPIPVPAVRWRVQTARRAGRVVMSEQWRAIAADFTERGLGFKETCERIAELTTLLRDSDQALGREQADVERLRMENSIYQRSIFTEPTDAATIARYLELVGQQVETEIEDECLDAQGGVDE